MSTMLIVALVVGGLVIVVSLGFFSQAIERARLERARALAELQARWNHCNRLNAALPRQFMSLELKQLLLKVEASLLERLLKLEPRNARHSVALTDVRQLLSKEEPVINNTALSITSDAAAKGVRRQLADLLQLLELARTDGLLDNQALARWRQQVHAHQPETTLNMYRTLAEQAMGEGKPRVAKLQYERAVAYLTKHPGSAQAEQMAVFRQLLIHAEQAAAKMEQAAPGTILSDGVQALEEDDQAWRKKALYDD